MDAYRLAEQAEMVDRIKEQNVLSNQQNRIALQLMLGLSCLLCVVSVLLVPVILSPVAADMSYTCFQTERPHSLPFSLLLSRPAEPLLHWT